MTKQAISPLRRRMIEDMTIRKFAQKTASYLWQHVHQEAADELVGIERHHAGSLPTFEAVILPLEEGFHRIRYYGLLTSPTRAKNIECIRELLAVPVPVDAIKAAHTKPEEPKAPEHPCPCCGGRMRIIETILPGQQPKHRPTPLPPAIRIDTS